VTVFINSHLLGEVEQLCDRVAILRKGKLMVTGTVADLTRQKASWQVAFDRELPTSFCFAGATVEAVEGGNRLRVSLDPADGPGPGQSADAPEGIDRFVAAASAAGLRLRHLERERATLEDLYLAIADGGGTP
jgi:ABC-2 type transport system ATP-binding protein